MEAFEFGDILIDIDTGRLRRGPEDLPLRPKSFALLAHLIRHRVVVQGKDDLPTAIWPDVIVSKDSLARCVADIRKTLSPGADRRIRRVTGRGDMIEDSHVRIARPAPTTDRAAPQHAERPVIAVRPFADLSRNGWFARGMTEEIMIGPTRLGEMTVVSAGPDAPAVPRGSIPAMWPARAGTASRWRGPPGRRMKGCGDRRA